MRGDASAMAQACLFPIFNIFSPYVRGLTNTPLTIFRPIIVLCEPSLSSNWMFDLCALLHNDKNLLTGVFIQRIVPHKSMLVTQ